MTRVVCCFDLHRIVQTEISQRDLRVYSALGNSFDEVNVALFAIYKVGVVAYSGLRVRTINYYHPYPLFVYRTLSYFLHLFLHNFFFICFPSLFLPLSPLAMSEPGGIEILLLISSTPGATMPGNSNERIGHAAEVGFKGRDTDDTLNISAVPLNWTVAVYKTQYPDC